MLFPLALLMFAVVEDVVGHGRLLEPPSRQSMWRFGYKTPINYNDNELYCGGFAYQWEKNGGKCGVCGDPWDKPHENEAGGKYATGIIVRHYKQGQIIDITLEITANHKGYFEFRICPNNDVNKRVTQKCLDKYLLQLEDGSTKYFVRTRRTGLYKMKLRLPDKVTCSQCLLQWKYNAGNSWGCENSHCCVGCGHQEQFYGCADVSISSVYGPFPTPPTTPWIPRPTTPWIPRPTTPWIPRPTTPDFDFKNCHALGRWTGNAGMTYWCILNCSRGSCPTGLCSPECRQH